MQYFGSHIKFSSYPQTLASILYATPNCNLTRLGLMLSAILPDKMPNISFNELLVDVLHLDTTRYRKLPTAFTFYRFVVTAIVGLLEQNTAYPTDYPKPMASGWPLLGLCQLLNTVDRELTSLEYIREIMPKVVGLYYNATGQATEYCIKPLGLCTCCYCFS